MRLYEKQQMAQTRLLDVEAKRDGLVKEARSEVGIWSTIGVGEVRGMFWDAWERGKEHAKRWTMMDAIFMMFPTGERERTIVTVILQIVFQYLVNLTMGLISAMFIFLWNVGSLCYLYGESLLSGVAFFALVAVTCVSVTATYLGAIGSVVTLGASAVLKEERKRLAAGGERRRQERVRY